MVVELDLVASVSAIAPTAFERALARGPRGLVFGWPVADSGFRIARVDSNPLKRADVIDGLPVENAN